nr:Fe-Mn family superoxide dismutase [Actinotignum sanguinis]
MRMASYTLPDLPYDYAALEPHISGKIMELHFYLDYLNVKADYVKAIWNIVNWEEVGARLAIAQEQSTGLLIRT